VRRRGGPGALNIGPGRSDGFGLGGLGLGGLGLRRLGLGGLGLDLRLVDGLGLGRRLRVLAAQQQQKTAQGRDDRESWMHGGTPRKPMPF